MNNVPNGFPTSVSSTILIAIYSLERFSYYGIIAIFVIYMTDSGGMNLGYDQTIINYGLFSNAISFMPLFAGLLSDFLLKRKNTILIGGLLCLLGYLLLIPANEYLFFIGIIPIALGTGLVRTNFIVMLGRLFKKFDSKRNIAFLFFIAFVNISSFLAMFSIGYLIEKYGLNLGFGLIILATVFYLILYFFSKNRIVFKEEDWLSIETKTNEKILDAEAIPNPKSNVKPIFIYALIIGLITNFFFWKGYNTLHSHTFEILSEKSPLFIFGREFPLEQLDSLTLFITIIVMFLMGLFWITKNSGSSIFKLAYGLLIPAIAFLFVYFLDKFPSDTILYPIFALSIFLAIGETLVSSISLSYITRTSSIKYSATIIGSYFTLLHILNYAWDYISIHPNIETYLVLIIAIILGIILLIFKKEIVQLNQGLD